MNTSVCIPVVPLTIAHFLHSATVYSGPKFFHYSANFEVIEIGLKFWDQSSLPDLYSDFTRASFQLLGRDLAENNRLKSVTSSSHKTNAKYFNIIFVILSIFELLPVSNVLSAFRTSEIESK